MRSLLYTFLITAILSFISPFCIGEEYNGVQLEITVRQKPPISEEYRDIFTDTVDAVEDHALLAFMINMSLEIDLLSADSSAALFNVHLTTIGKRPYNYSQKYKIEYNLPARIENIPGKHESVYQVLITPRRRIDVDTSSCTFNPRDTTDFKMDPSANFDLYYVSNSLGDFYWNNIKNYLEADYSRFRNILSINMPGKIAFYICPCPPWSVHLDKRFGYMIDPTRSNIFAIYSHEFKSVDVFLPNLMTLYKFWGYAPPLLAEGLAGYFEFNNYKIKELIASDSVPQLENLLSSKEYYRMDPITAEIGSGSFVKFLTDSYGIKKFKTLYDASDDLNIKNTLPAIYGTSLDSLDMLWRHYIDTVQFNRVHFDYQATRSAVMLRGDLQTKYLEDMLEYDINPADSIDNYQRLGTAYYQYGDYYKAIEVYEHLLEFDQVKPLYLQILGNLYLINGLYDSAAQFFDRAYAMDSMITTAKLNLARANFYQGDTSKALEIAEEYYIKESSTPGRIEFLLFMGHIYKLPGPWHDSAKAYQSFGDAAIWAEEMIPKSPQDPASKMRAGLAYLGLGEYERARQYLEFAHFTELRSYHLGRTLIALGRLYDLTNRHERAIEYYQEALSHSIAVHQEKLAREYIVTPFSY